jgi:hypothetical protein
VKLNKIISAKQTAENFFSEPTLAFPRFTDNDPAFARPKTGVAKRDAKWQNKNMNMDN